MAVSDLVCHATVRPGKKKCEMKHALDCSIPSSLIIIVGRSKVN